MAMPRNRPAPKETEPIRAHKNQNTIEGKQKAGGWGRFAPQPPALIDKVSRMSRNEVSRMSWNLTLKHAPPGNRRLCTDLPKTNKNSVVISREL